MSKFPIDACALRPVRFLGDNALRYYEAVEFLTENPAGSCAMYRNRCKAFSGVTTSIADAAGTCDVLNKDGDIVDDFLLTDKGLKWLYKALGTRVDRTADGEGKANG